MVEIQIFTTDDSPTTVRSAWSVALKDLARTASLLEASAVSPYVWDLQGLGPLFDALVKNPGKWIHTKYTTNTHREAIDDTLDDLVSEAIALLELIPHSDPRAPQLFSQAGLPTKAEAGTLTATEVGAVARSEAVEKGPADPEQAQRALQLAGEWKKAIDTLNTARRVLLDKLLDFQRANPKLSRAFSVDWAYRLFQRRPERQARVRSSEPQILDREERERRVRARVEEAARRALADLSAGTAKRYVSSGIAGRPHRHAWDPQTGLLIVDTGCIVSSETEEYNRVVTEWIASHGSPPGSMKHRFLTQEIAQAALFSARPLQRGDQVPAPDGRAILRTAPRADDPHGTHQLRVVSTAGHTTWYEWLSGFYDRLDVAWSSRGSWFVYFTGNGLTDRVSVWHVDADGDGVLQSFTVQRASAPESETL